MKSLLFLIMALYLTGCSAYFKEKFVTRTNCYEKYPPVVLDSSFIIDTIIITKGFQTTFIQNVCDSDSIIELYKDSLITVIGNKDSIKVIVKDRFQTISTCNIDCFINVIGKIKKEKDLYQERYYKTADAYEKQKNKKELWLWLGLGGIAALCLLILGIFLISKLLK